MSETMRLKAVEVVEWRQAQGHEIIVGDPRGIDRVVRWEAMELGVRFTVYGAYEVIR